MARGPIGDRQRTDVLERRRRLRRRSVSRRNTSSSRWRPAAGRQGRSSASHASGDVAGGRAATRYSPAVDLGDRDAEVLRRGRRRRGRRAPRSGARRAWPCGVSSVGVPSASSRPWSMMTTRSASLLGLVEVVGGEQHGHAVGRAVDDHHVADQLAARRVDAGRGLVEERDLGPADQRQRERQPLLLAARHRRHVERPPVGEADPVEQLVGIGGVVVVGGEQAQHLDRLGCRCRRRPPAASRRCAATSSAWSATGSRPEHPHRAGWSAAGSPRASRRSMVLPAPFGPSRAMIVPGSAANDRSSTAVSSP